MDIPQNSTLHILKDVPLDITYEHTIYFDDTDIGAGLAAQEAYFANKRRREYTLENYSYLRPQKAIKVGLPSDSLYYCNYLHFRNNGHGQKNWFAFIKDIEYINDTTSLITFEIDVMQTWYWNYTLKPSFVEREHVENDAIGANLKPENLGFGEYKIRSFEGTGKFNRDDMAVCVAVTLKPTDILDEATPQPVRYGGVMGATQYDWFNNQGQAIGLTSPTTLKGYLQYYNEKGMTSSIVSMFMFPNEFRPAGDPSPEDGVATVIKNKSITKNNSDLDGYVPKNKKLLTYPYNFFTVVNNSGESIDYMYEFFETSDCVFRINGAVSCNPQFLLLPMGYKGIDGIEYSTSDSMVLSGFPQCSYNNDLYLEWAARNATSQKVSKDIDLFRILSGVGLAVAGNVPGGVGQAISGITSISQTMAREADAKMLPTVPGSKGGASAYYSADYLDFCFVKKTITAEYAKIIDKYFDMFGYTVNTVKVPNRSTRPVWNYTKTHNVNIVGSLPADVMAQIKAVYNKGVTFWKNGDNIGNYDLNNH